jgi:hypothetical protein
LKPQQQAERQKVVVLRSQSSVQVAPEVINRDFLMQLRRAVLQQLAVIEKQLGLTRRCGKCGHDVLT